MSSTGKKLTPSSSDYEDVRSQFFNARVPALKPAVIYQPTTTAEVAAIMKNASTANLNVGVRSGGHLFVCASLVEDGVLLDTSKLNKSIVYDSATKIVAFSPGHRVHELATELGALKRFFPWGHSRDVGAGGFLLAGGQGVFVRGWGYTSDTWVTQLEIVTAKGEVVLCNKEDNADLFWAAPGSGRGFFGVITRIWARTLAARKIFDTTIVVDSTECFKPLLKWVLETSEKVPKYGVDLFFLTFRSDMDEPGDGEESDRKRIMFLINETVWADSLEEAKVLASPWDKLPDEFAEVQVQRVAMQERSWEELWAAQERFQPQGNGERWNVDSILTDPRVSHDDLIEAITPALYELPTRLTTGTICPLDYYPDEADQALSLPQKCYVSAMNCWKDPERDAANDAWMQRVFERAEKVSCGIYVADVNEKARDALVMTPSALDKWLKIRAHWDPDERFTGHRAFTRSRLGPVR
ncbi:FAD-binding domain-containing protein [Pyrenochaeta sp. DS3sAY3a]|nr:FAD-binding domain-containing protein [Pyrenochaeta sp. DS3sAY3a]